MTYIRNPDPGFIVQADEEIDALKRQLSIAEQNARDWENRYRTLKRQAPSANSVIVELNPEPHATLAREATIRKLRLQGLAKLLLEQVAIDKLFAAILDR